MCVGCSRNLVSWDRKSIRGDSVLSSCHPVSRPTCHHMGCTNIRRGGPAASLHSIRLRSVRFHLWRRGTGSLHHGPHAWVRYTNTHSTSLHISAHLSILLSITVYISIPPCLSIYSSLHLSLSHHVNMYLCAAAPEDPPYNLSVWNVTSKSVSVSWDPPTIVTGRFSYVIYLYGPTGKHTHTHTVHHYI